MQNEKFQTIEKHEQGRRDYVAFDEVLDIIHNVFQSLHGSLFSEERWRWDAPVITFTWGNGADINRNLNGLVLGDQRPTGVEIESNAWRDMHEGVNLIRYWQHFPAGRINSTPLSNKKIASLVKKAYMEVNSWTVEHLQDHKILPHS
ncbi:MAG TPA: hypothetical protein VJ842_15010 [Pyrinomonadaceae bacterium]|nr:hypothetical protein [Pyrinomonadaceae bacterium]